jgi:hypothetical protein
MIDVKPENAKDHFTILPVAQMKFLGAPKPFQFLIVGAMSVVNLPLRAFGLRFSGFHLCFLSCIFFV